MSHPTPPPRPEDANRMLRRIHQLGAATETMFQRLYQGLNSNAQLAEAQATLDRLRQQAQQASHRNRMLRQMLQQRTIEVERLEAILASISEGILLQDSAGRIVMMNQAAEEMLGSQRNFWNSELGVLFKQSRDLPSATSELAPIGEALRVQLNKRILSAQIASIADHEGQRIGTMMILRDVTQDELNQRMKNSFVSQISHELITPLASMRVASEIVRNTPDDQAPNRRMLEMIGRNIDLLDRMVTEMLDMSAITSGSLELQPEAISVPELIWDVVDDFTEDINDAGLDVTVMLRETRSLHLRGDAKYLRWALSNLLRNAIQYNEPREHITVQARLDRQFSQLVRLDVVDTGVGISQEDFPHIFDLFYRGEPRNRSGKRLDPRGLGQGLFVAKTIVQAHQGDILAESSPGEGSTFTVRLPLQPDLALPAAR